MMMLIARWMIGIIEFSYGFYRLVQRFAGFCEFWG